MRSFIGTFYQLLCLWVFMVLLFSGAFAGETPNHIDVFTSGQGGYHTYRIPVLITTKKGTLLSFCEGRKTSTIDDGDNDLLLRRSTDAGKTWQPMQLVHEEGGDAIITIGNPCPVVDQTTGVVWLTMTRNNDRVFVSNSKDDGQNWARAREITHQVKKPGWGWYATGPGVGIQMQFGEYKGRLVIPSDHRKTLDRSGPSSAHVFYSDDHGKTWELGEAVGDHSNECQVAERSDGTLLINARNHWLLSGGRSDLAFQRIIATSGDGGRSWSDPSFDEALIEPQCQASLIRYPRANPDSSVWMLFSNPASKSGRERMTVRLSPDEGRTWPLSRVLYQGKAAYSCLTVLPDGRIGLLYERDGSAAITFTVFSLEWLTGP